MKLNVKNRRGDLPTVILVVMVFVLLTATLVSFAISETKTQTSFANIGTFENLTLNLNEFYFYLHSGVSPQDAAKFVGGTFDASTNQLTLQQKDRDKLSVKYIINLNK